MALRTAVYLRRSSKDREDKQVHSIERQDNDTKAYLEKNERAEMEGVKRLVCDPQKDVYVEDASAKYPGRPVFNEMVKQIEKNKYDVLLCTDFSRLSRNAIDNGVIVQLLEDGHLREIRTTDKVFTTSPTDKFTLSLFLSVAKYENDQRALNTISGMNNRKAVGATTHRPPIGYINCGEEKGKKWIEPDGDNFDKARRLWELFMTGDYSINDLERSAHDMGLTLVIGKRRSVPTASTIRNMLSNPYYLGKVKMVDKDGKEVWKDANHKPMVTQDEFDKVQYILQKNGYKHVKLDKVPDLVQIIKIMARSGIYKIKDRSGEVRPASLIYEKKCRYTCLHCGNRYTSNATRPCPRCDTEVTKDTKVIIDERFSHHAEGKQKKDSIQLEKIVEFLKAELSKLYISENLFQVLRRELYTLWLEKNKFVNNRRKELKGKIEGLEEKRGDLYAKKMTQDTDQKELAFAITAVEKKLDKFEQELTKLREQHEEDFEKAWQTLQVLRDAKELLNEKVGFEPKKRLILSLGSNLVFYKDKIEMVWKKPFNLLAQKGIDRNAKNKSGLKLDGKNFDGSLNLSQLKLWFWMWITVRS